MLRPSIFCIIKLSFLYIFVRKFDVPQRLNNAQTVEGSNEVFGDFEKLKKRKETARSFTKFILLEASVFPTCTSVRCSSVIKFCDLVLKSIIIWKDPSFKEDIILFVW